MTTTPEGTFRDLFAHLACRTMMTARAAANLSRQGISGTDQAQAMLDDLAEQARLLGSAALGADATKFSDGRPVVQFYGTNGEPVTYLWQPFPQQLIHYLEGDTNV